MQSKDNIYYVYALVDPINSVPFYIGKGKDKRAWDHIKGFSKYNSNKNRYIDNIRMLGFEPEVHIIIDNLSNDFAKIYEASCIVYGKKINLPLTNIKLLEGGNNWNEETRKKVSETMKRKGLKPPSRKGKTWKCDTISKMDLSIKENIIEVYKSGKLTNKEIYTKFNISFYIFKKILKRANLI
jgi:hypothetical protein